MRTLLLPLNTTFRVARTGHVRGLASSLPRRGPIEITAQLLHSIHDLSGLTYGAAIPLAAIAFRTIVTLPLSIYSQKKLNRRIELHPLFHQWGDIIGIQAVARAKANNVDLRGNREAHAKMMTTVQKMVNAMYFRSSDEWQLSRRMKIIYERHGCTRVRILFPALVQIPLFLLVSLALRSMSGWAGWIDVGLTIPIEPLLQVEGFGAIKNLTQPDGTYILPVMIGLFNVTNLEITAARRSVALPEERIASRLRKITRLSFLTLSALMIPIAMQAPAAISLYWATSAAYSLVQNLLMQRFLPIEHPYRPRLSYQRGERKTKAS